MIDIDRLLALNNFSYTECRNDVIAIASDLADKYTVDEGISPYISKNKLFYGIPAVGFYKGFMSVYREQYGSPLGDECCLIFDYNFADEYYLWPISLGYDIKGQIDMLLTKENQEYVDLSCVSKHSIYSTYYVMDSAGDDVEALLRLLGGFTWTSAYISSFIQLFDSNTGISARLLLFDSCRDHYCRLDRYATAALVRELRRSKNVELIYREASFLNPGGLYLRIGRMDIFLRSKTLNDNRFIDHITMHDLYSYGSEVAGLNYITESFMRCSTSVDGFCLSGDPISKDKLYGHVKDGKYYECPINLDRFPFTRLDYYINDYAIIGWYHPNLLFILPLAVKVYYD